MSIGPIDFLLEPITHKHVWATGVVATEGSHYVRYTHTKWLRYALNDVDHDFGKNLIEEKWDFSDHNIMKEMVGKCDFYNFFSSNNL